MRKLKFKNFAVFLGTFLVSIFLFYTYNNKNVHAAKTSLPLNQLQAFSEVYLKIKQNYVQEISDKEIFDNALKVESSKILLPLEETISYFNISPDGAKLI